MVTEYKKTPLTEVNNRQTASLTATEKERVKDIVNRFFALFAAEHS